MSEVFSDQSLSIAVVDDVHLSFYLQNKRPISIIFALVIFICPYKNHETESKEPCHISYLDKRNSDLTKLHYFVKGVFGLKGYAVLHPYLT